MNGRRNALSPGSNDHIGPDEIFSQVMGPERSGWLQMCGGGVAPSDIWGVTPTRTAQHLAMAEQRRRIAMLEERDKMQPELILEQDRLLAEVGASMVQNNLSNHSRAGSLESDRQATPTNTTNLLRVLVPITKRIIHIFC
jgi:hypothetical protein